MENIRLIRSNELNPDDPQFFGASHDLYVVTNPAWNRRLKDKSSHVGFERHCERLLDATCVQGVTFSPRADAFIFEALDF